MPRLTLSPDAAKITAMAFVAVYVDDYAKAIEFYRDILGLEKSHDAEKDACFFTIGANTYGLFVAGGARSKKVSAEDTHASFVLLVESVSALHQRLKLNGARVVQDEPV